MADIEQRIREHAFQLWEAAGCPDNRAEEFWLRAQEVEQGLTQPAEQPAMSEEDDPAKFAGF